MMMNSGFIVRILAQCCTAGYSATTVTYRFPGTYDNVWWRIFSCLLMDDKVRLRWVLAPVIFVMG